MQTPYLPQAIFQEDLQHVYEPAEDTFLLLDALENDLDKIRETVSICLEFGSGSGTIITALSLALADNKKRLMIATDINPYACRTTKKCANYYKQDHIQVVRTDLAQSLVDRLEGSVDLLMFNPPYVPTDFGEELASDHGQLRLSWAGGDDGRETINKFLRSYVPRLLSKPNGSAYMVALDQNNITELKKYLENDHKIDCDVVLKRRAGAELLYILRYRWSPDR